MEEKKENPLKLQDVSMMMNPIELKVMMLMMNRLPPVRTAEMEVMMNPLIL